MIQIIRTSAIESGKRTYHVERGGKLLGIIRYFDRRACIESGRRDLDAHWALLHIGGRVDRFDAFNDARDDALKM